MTIRGRRTTPETLAFSGGSDNVCSANYEAVSHLTETSVPCASGVRLPSVAWRGQAPIVDRFWSRVNKNGPVPEHCRELGPCWLWTGCIVARYGQISLGHPSTPGAKRWKTHRFSWELHHGPIPPTLKVCHRCDVPTCVNPAHLFLGTQAQNIHDSVHKGRKRTWGIQKLNAEDVTIIRRQAARGMLQKDIAQAFGISRNHVSSIVTRKVWAHLAPLSVQDAPQDFARLVQFPEQGPDTVVGRRQGDEVGLVCGDDRLPDVVRGAGAVQGVAIR